MMLNPSTATDEVDDPTIRRVTRFTRDAGYDELIVVNLFAIRATNPKRLAEMARDHHIVGADNQEKIRQAIDASKAVVCAWGAQPIVREYTMARFVVLAASTAGRPLVCLGVTKAGHPKHPLYVRADQPFVPYKGGL